MLDVKAAAMDCSIDQKWNRGSEPDGVDDIACVRVADFDRAKGTWFRLRYLPLGRLASLSEKVEF